MSDFSNDTAFDFSESFQEAIIGYCIHDLDFFKKASTKLKPSYFSANPKLATIFEQLVKAKEIYGEAIVSTAELKDRTYFRELKNEEKVDYFNTIDRCVGVTLNNYSLNKIEQDLTGFLRMCLFKEAIQGASKKYNSSKNSPATLENTYSWTKAKMLELNEATFLNESRVEKLGDVIEWLKKRKELEGVAISTGSKAMDNALGGGLFKQDNSAIMAATNQGKTRALLTVARHAIFKKKYVLVITHEDVPDKIKEQILMSYLCISKSTLKSWIGDPKMETIVTKVSKFIDQYLYFMPFNKAGQMFVEDVIDESRRLHEELKSKNGGKGFDLIIDDYPKKLKMKSRMHNRDNIMRAELAEIYDHFVQLAIELDLHVMMAIQTNRTGLKKSKQVGDDKSALGLEDTDEAFGIAQNIANVISLSRSPTDKEKNIVKFMVIKSRNGQTDVPIFSRSAYGANVVFGDRDFITPPGNLWSTDIPNNYLPAYEAKAEAAGETTETIDNQLKSMEEGFKPNVDENGNNVSIGAAKLS